MPYTVSFGRSDGSAFKYLEFKSRIRALFCANAIAFVLFLDHPFRTSVTRGTVKVEKEGFYVQFSDTGEIHGKPGNTQAGPGPDPN